MSQEVKHIGMDVHKEAIVIAVLNGSGKLVMETILETKASSILQFIHGLRGELHVTWEEGTWAAWLYDLLKPQVHEIAGLGPRIDGIKGFGLLCQVVAVALEVFIPVRKLDRDLDFRIDRASRGHDQIARDVVHSPHPRVGPTLITLGSDIRGGLGVGEEEVIEDDFIEVLGGQLRDRFP
jgi:hypothetical protein